MVVGMTEEIEEIMPTTDFELSDETPSTKKTRRSTAKRSVRTRRTSASVDAILKGINLSHDMSDEDVLVLSSLLGVPAERNVVAAHIASGAKADTSIIEAILSVHETDDPIEAGIEAHVLTEDRRAFAKAWRIVGISTEIPKSSTQAASHFARAIGQMTESSISALRRPLDLLEK